MIKLCKNDNVNDSIHIIMSKLTLKPHMSLSKTLYPLYTGSTQEDPSRHDWKVVD